MASLNESSLLSKRFHDPLIDPDGGPKFTKELFRELVEEPGQKEHGPIRDQLETLFRDSLLDTPALHRSNVSDASLPVSHSVDRIRTILEPPPFIDAINPPPADYFEPIPFYPPLSPIQKAVAVVMRLGLDRCHMFLMTQGLTPEQIRLANEIAEFCKISDNFLTHQSDTQQLSPINERTDKESTPVIAEVMNAQTPPPQRSQPQSRLQSQSPQSRSRSQSEALSPVIDDEKQTNAIRKESILAMDNALNLASTLRPIPTSLIARTVQFRKLQDAEFEKKIQLASIQTSVDMAYNDNGGDRSTGVSAQISPLSSHSHPLSPIVTGTDDDDDNRTVRRHNNDPTPSLSNDSDMSLYGSEKAMTPPTEQPQSIPAPNYTLENQFLDIEHIVTPNAAPNAMTTVPPTEQKTSPLESDYGLSNGDLLNSSDQQPTINDLSHRIESLQFQTEQFEEVRARLHSATGQLQDKRREQRRVNPLLPGSPSPKGRRGGVSGLDQSADVKAMIEEHVPALSQRFPKLNRELIERSLELNPNDLETAIAQLEAIATLVENQSDAHN